MASQIDTQNSNIYDQYSVDRLQQSETTGNQELGQAEFLSLMTTQLNNQSPVNPMDNQAFVAQMAQFSMVTGISEMQQSFNAMAANLQSNRALEASMLVGRDVFVKGDTMQIDQGGEIAGAIDVDNSYDDVQLVIKGPSGELIKSVSLGPQTEGTLDFSWDGTNASGEAVAAGAYSVSVEGRRYGQNSQTLSTSLRAQVESVNLRGNSGDTKLRLAGLGEVPMANIVEVGLSDSEAA